MADLNFKSCSLGPKKATFGSKRPNEGKRWVQSTCGLTSPCQGALCGMICAGDGPKRPPEAQNADSHKPRIGHIFGYMAQNAIPRARTPPATPHFLWFPKQTPRPQYLGPLGRGKLQAQAQTGGCPNGSTGSSRGKKMTFLRNDPRSCATLKQVFLDRFELVVAHFGPPKIPKCLENGVFWDQKWVKSGSKTHFYKPHPGQFGVHKRVK